MRAGTKNSGRVAGCNAAALLLTEDGLLQAIRIGDRPTRRVALRNLKKLRVASAVNLGRNDVL